MLGVAKRPRSIRYATRQRRSLVLAVMMAVLATPLLPQAAEAAYYKNCTANDGHSPTWHAYRNLSGRQYTEAAGVTVIRALHECTNGSDNLSAVMAANVQGSCTPFTQLGYGRVDGYAQAWLYTPDDNSCGALQFYSSTLSPLVGHVVKFLIFQSGTQWYYEIYDETLGMLDIHTRVRHANYGNEVWYGIEVHNNNDQFGGAGSANIVLLYDLSYNYVGASSIAYLTGTSQVAWANQGTIPSYWLASKTTIPSNSHTELTGDTTNHP